MHISTVNTKFMFPPLNKKVDQPYIFWKILCKFMLKHASHDLKFLWQEFHWQWAFASRIKVWKYRWSLFDKEGGNG